MTIQKVRGGKGEVRRKKSSVGGLQGAGGPPAYNPVTALGADLLGYWEVNRADLITQSAGLVSSWKDVIAGYDAVQATGSAQPLYSASSFNGKPGIAFDGLDDCLATTANPFPVGGASFEMWALFSQDDLAANAGDRTIFAVGGNVTTGQASIRRTSTGGFNRGRSTTGNGTTSLTLTETTTDLSGRHVERARYTSTTTFLSVNNGTEVSMAAVPAITTGRTRIGALASTVAANFHQGQIAAIMVTNPIFGTGKEAPLMTYLLGRK